MDQAVQVVGSLLVLAAFVAAQLGATSTKSRIYLALKPGGVDRADDRGGSGAATGLSAA